MQNTATPPLRITVLGTGQMGAPIAANLAGNGFAVRAWNRTPARAQALTAQGVDVQPDAATSVDGADVVLTMLTDGVATAGVIDDARPAPGTIWVQMATVGVRATAQLIEQARTAGLDLVDAPVLGSDQPARQGRLVVLASGNDPVRARVQPVFDALGQRTFWLGPAGRGSALKLALNTWLATLVEGIGESMALAASLGVDPALVLEALDGAPAGSPYALTKGRAMLSGELDPGFPLKHATKDVDLVVAAARELDLDLPVAEAILPAWRSVVQAGGGDRDLAAAGTRYPLAPR